MGVSGQMDPLDFLTNEQLLFFLHRKKTEISCIEQPHRLLTQLRDHDLVPEKLFENVKKMRTREQKEKGVYEVLDWLEKKKPQRVQQFWRCVFEDHILQLYPTLRMLRNSLLNGTFEFCDKPPDVETPTEEEESEGKAEKGKGKNKRKRSKDDRSSEDSDDPGTSSASTPSRKKPAKKPSFSSPLKKGDEQEVWTWPIYKTQLPVTCGKKEGTLYRDKLPAGERCILSSGRWFTPADFEKFGGKERCKNWKSSIRCRNTPLKKLIEEGHLQCPPMERKKRTCVQKNMNKQFPVSSSETSSEDLETSSGSVEESDAEDFQEQGGRGRGTEFRGRVEEEEEEEEDMADLSVFQTPSLPVTCVSLTGTLYKYRFASGSRGKCIRTEERWFTPEEFVKQEQTLTNGHWKKDILCHGKTLNFLDKKQILRIHSLLCECRKCSTQEKDVMAQNNDDECYVCRSVGDLVCCDECPRAFHSHCHLPVVYGDSPGEWICTFCVLRNSQQWRDSTNMSEQEASDAPVSQYILHCHYLLLCVYREDIQKVFVEDPCRTVPRYSEFITQPMWLDRIKQKLESGEYQTVGAFVSDFQLIFSNCSTFNRDNEFGRMGARLKEMFEEEFQKIFSISTQYYARPPPRASPPYIHSDDYSEFSAVSEEIERMDGELFTDSAKDWSSSSESDWMSETGKRKEKQGVKRKKNQQNGNKKKTARTQNSSLQGVDLTDVFQEVRQKDQLAVHCGRMAGRLDKIKYDNGEKCISCKGKWFTPPQFEKFGGKGHNKKWKSSIYYKASNGQQVNLLKLTQNGCLSEFGQQGKSIREVTKTESGKRLISKTLEMPVCQTEEGVIQLDLLEDVLHILSQVSASSLLKSFFCQRVFIWSSTLTLKMFKVYVCFIPHADSSSDESISVAERVKMVTKSRKRLFSKRLKKTEEEIIQLDSSTDESVSVAERVKKNRRESVISAETFSKRIPGPESIARARGSSSDEVVSVAERVKMNRRESVILAKTVCQKITELVESPGSARDSPASPTDATEPAVSSVIEEADQTTDEAATAAQLTFCHSPPNETAASPVEEETDQTTDEAAGEAAATAAQLNFSDSPTDATEPAVSPVIDKADQTTDEAAATAAQLTFCDSPPNATEPAVFPVEEEADQTTDKAEGEATARAAQLNFSDSPTDATEAAVSPVEEEADETTDEAAGEAAATAAQLNFSDSPSDATEPVVSSVIEEADETTDEAVGGAAKAAQLNFSDFPSDATEPAVSSVIEEADETTDEATAAQLNLSDSPTDASEPAVSPVVEEAPQTRDKTVGETAAAAQLNFSNSPAESHNPVASKETEKTGQMQLLKFLENQFNTMNSTLKSIELSLKKLVEKQSQNTQPQYICLIPAVIENVKKEPITEGGDSTEEARL
ncbi:LOW QUALITY PROTEIN: uncharacterized protein LOC127159069 [Labeo rohita]|uniref:LOW QUALITY PROTEIN: uncharacterized protein LOC127159069 n=1 Tax=Labeo rohita TaxID=84645 RepID=UPI0021E2F99E|nr:LOW QUALITY PROTEIN: uncharacterized protein LOC127159069 [Labeo rohita]